MTWMRFPKVRSDALKLCENPDENGALTERYEVFLHIFCDYLDFYVIFLFFTYVR